MTGLWILFGFKFVTEIVIFFAAFKMSISMSEWCRSVTGTEMLWNIPKNLHMIAELVQIKITIISYFSESLIFVLMLLQIVLTILELDFIYIHNRIALTQTKSSFCIPIERFYRNMRIIDWEWDCFLLSTFQLALSWSAEFINPNSKIRLAGQKD